MEVTMVMILIGYVTGIIMIEIFEKIKLNKMTMMMEKPNRWKWVEVQNETIKNLHNKCCDI